MPLFKGARSEHIDQISRKSRSPNIMIHKNACFGTHLLPQTLDSEPASIAFDDEQSNLCYSAGPHGKLQLPLLAYIKGGERILTK